MFGKEDILGWLRRPFIFLLLRTREGYMPTITKSRLIPSEGTPFKHAWARLPSIEIDRDFAIIDLAYLFTGLVTIAQSRLVHRILQGVEHTDPTEWSNSHLSIGDKFVMAVRRTACLFIRCSLFLPTIILVIYVVTAPQHSYYLKVPNPSKYGSQLCIHIMCCLRTAYSYISYISILSTCHSNTTQIKYIHSLCNGSNSLRVHEQLISGCPNSSEPNSSEHNKSWSAPPHLVYWL